MWCKCHSPDLRSAYCYILPPVFVCVFTVLSPDSAAAARRCHSIYKGFAQCLMALGDSLTDNARRDEDTNEIHSICRSVCAGDGLPRGRSVLRRSQNLDRPRLDLFRIISHVLIITWRFCEITSLVQSRLKRSGMDLETLTAPVYMGGGTLPPKGLIHFIESLLITVLYVL